MIILSIVSQMDITTTILEIVLAFVILSIISAQLYGYSPLFLVVEQLLAGMLMGNHLLTVYKSFWNGQFTPLMKGNLTFIGPIILGILTFTFFKMSTRPVYRAIMVYNGSVAIGTAMVTVWTTTITSIISYTKVTSINNLALGIPMILGIFYFAFSRSLSTGQFANLKKIGRYAIFIYIGSSLGPMWMRYQNSMIGWTIRIVENPGVWLLPIFFVVFLIQIVVGWPKILGMGDFGLHRCVSWWYAAGDHCRCSWRC